MNLFFRVSILIVFMLSGLAAGVMSQTSDRLVPLDKGALAYIFTEVKEARPVLDILPVKEFRTWQTLIILESTNTAAAALFPKESGKRFQVVGWGNYPSFRAGIALFISRSWKRQRAETGTFWQNANEKLSVVLLPKQVFAVSWHTNPGSPIPAPSGVIIPDGYNDFRRRTGRNAPLSGWMDSPAPLLNQIFNKEGLSLALPAQRLFINLTKAGESYEVLIRLQFDSIEQAQNAAGVFAQADMAIKEGEQKKPNPVLMSVFFANAPFQQGLNLELKSAVLDIKEVALLLQMFQLYWN
jgi:hypothetical protein